MGALRALLLMAAAGWAGAARLRGDGGKAQSSSQRRFLLPDLHDDTLPFQANESAAVSTRTPMRAEFVSWAPRIVHLHDFLSQGEADHIVNLARANMVRSTVVDSAHGTQASVVDEIRTSTGTFLAPAQDAVLADIERRIAELTMLPIENQEALQVLHYGINERYGAHMDVFGDPRFTTPDVGGERIATLLMFLNTPEEGGETVFPNVDGTEPPPGASKCAQSGLAVKPRKGNAVLFWSLRPDGSIDNGATHTACPVIRGEKWSAPKWIRVGEFQHKAPVRQPAGECMDFNDNCRAWASEGECERNSAYMTGSDGTLGQCRESCGLCPYPRKGSAPRSPAVTQPGKTKAATQQA